MDALEASVQLVAWVRVSAELLGDAEDAARAGVGGVSSWGCGGDVVATRRWALRFCTRCVDRCVPALAPGGSEFPAWEVLSELSRLHERRARCSANTAVFDRAWADDCDAWCHTLEGAARVVARHYQHQAREFLLLASCTGSPLPGSVERILLDARSATDSGDATASSDVVAAHGLH